MNNDFSAQHTSTTPKLNQQVRQYWEKEPCGTNSAIVGQELHHGPEWFDRVEKNRYRLEPIIPEVAQFEKYAGKKILEIGVGAGSDHLQWAKAGAECHGVDLTDAAIETTREHLALHGLKSVLQRVDAEKLPFENDFFDVAYSWGVIHHSSDPEKIVREIHRVLKPGGQFIGMVYGRWSMVAIRLWIRFGLLRGKPWRSLSDVVWHHMESIGTKSYLPEEAKELFGVFQKVEVESRRTSYDERWLPPLVGKLVPNKLGWFLVIRATK